MALLRVVCRPLLAVIVCVAVNARGAAPKLDHLSPVAGAQGSTTAVTAVGGFDPWPPQVWVDSPGIVFKPAEKAPEWQVEIAADAAPGPHLVRFFNQEGASELRFFIVTKDADLAEVEPNDDFAAPQAVPSLPKVVSGRLDKGGDVDSYSVQLKKGQTLVASLDAYRLASTFDGLLRVVDAAGVQHAFNHDSQTMDPSLAWEAPHDGTYVVQVMGFAYPANAEVRFTGGPGCVYRLHLSAGPVLRHTVPMAVTRGTKMPLQLVGWNLPEQTAEVDATTPPPAELAALIAAGEEQLRVPLSECPELTEPTAGDAEPLSLPIPGAVSGKISRRAEQDRYTFTAKKGQIYRIQLTAAAAGSSLDGWLRIKDKDGKELAAADDHNASRDPEMSWAAPADDVFEIVIGEITHRGGEDFFYRASVREEFSSVTASTAEHALKVESGKTAEMKVTVKNLHGFKNKLRLITKGLPDGVSAPPVDVPEAGGEVSMKFEAQAEAEAAGGAIQLALQEIEGGKEYPVRYYLVNTSENNGVPQGYSSLVIESTDQLWLSVSKPAAK